ncbi:MAG: hypothetical protein Q8R67_25880 [Rhodoferax sp.]|nr:hypothetical protein [Rhodoferax sp.]MDP3655103.1 hypothetical protein [Rhodoferax sp.]
MAYALTQLWHLPRIDNPLQGIAHGASVHALNRQHQKLADDGCTQYNTSLVQ